MKVSRRFASGLLLSIPFFFPSANSLFQIAVILPGLFLALGAAKNITPLRQLLFFCLTISVWFLGIFRFGSSGLFNFAFVAFLFVPISTFAVFNKFFAFFAKSNFRLFLLAFCYLSWPLINIPLSPTRKMLSSSSLLGAVFDFEDKSYNPLTSIISVGNRLFNIDYLYLIIYFLALATILFFFSKRTVGLTIYFVSLVLSSLTLSVGIVTFCAIYGLFVYMATFRISDLGLSKYLTLNSFLTVAFLFCIAISFLLISPMLRELTVAGISYIADKVMVEFGFDSGNSSFSVVNNLQNSQAAVTRVSQLELLNYTKLWPIGTGASLPSVMGRGSYNLEFSLVNILHKYGYLLGGFLIVACYVWIPSRIYFFYREILTKKNKFFSRSHFPVLMQVALFGSLYLCVSIYSLSNPVFGSPQFIISGLAIISLTKKLKSIP